jgi:hypothetical protein
MWRLATDEDFHGNIIRALMQRQPTLDLVRIQDAGLIGDDDAAILEWAANENRVLLSRDRRTMPRFAYERIQRGESMPGLILLRRRAAQHAVIEELELLVTCCEPDECRDQVLYVPIGS